MMASTGIKPAFEAAMRELARVSGEVGYNSCAVYVKVGEVKAAIVGEPTGTRYLVNFNGDFYERVERDG